MNTIIIVAIVVILIVIGYVLIDKCKCKSSNSNISDMLNKENMNFMHNAYQDDEMGPYSLSGDVYDFSDMDILQNRSKMDGSALRSLLRNDVDIDTVRPQDSDCSCYSGTDTQRKPCPPLHYFNYNTGNCEPIFQGDATPERIWSRKPRPEPIVSLPGSTLDEYGASLNVPREALLKIGKELVTLKSNQ